jgi:GNAT superfamily N-acetyltransferase
VRALRVRLAPVDEIRPLRAAVLRPGLPAQSAVWPGDDDPAALHLAACSPDGPNAPDAPGLVGVVSLVPAAYPGPGGEGAGPRAGDGSGTGPRPGAPGYQLRGMAVAPAAQGTGVGGALLRAVLDELGARRATLVWCNARLAAARFYERGGFVRDGGEFALAPLGIVHVRMHRPVPAPEADARRPAAQQSAQQSARQGGTSP